MGVLNSLYELHLGILSVTCEPWKKNGNTADQQR
jgi:hypothetical protein